MGLTESVGLDAGKQDFTNGIQGEQQWLQAPECHLLTLHPAHCVGPPKYCMQQEDDTRLIISGRSGSFSIGNSVRRAFIYVTFLYVLLQVLRCSSLGLRVCRALPGKEYNSFV